MFTNSVNKEFVFSLFLKFYPEVILDLTGYDIPKLELEKNYNGRKIDIFGEMYKRDVFIENQITKADERHFQQVEFIIENVQASKNTTIIWTAENFDREMIERVQRKIDGSGKNIEFIAIRINKELIAELDNYTNMSEFEIIKKLELLLLKNRLELLARYYKRQHKGECKSKDEEGTVILTEKEQIMEEILWEVRKQLYYFPNVHRDKNMAGNVLTLGAGSSDTVYAIGINRYSEIFLELRFNQGAREDFNFLYKEKEKIDDYFDYLFDWDTQLFKLYSVHPYTDENIDKVIKRQVRKLDRLVKNNSFIREIIDGYRIYEKCSIWTD